MALTAACLFFSHTVNAVWLKIDSCELIKSSDLIISGIFLGRTKLTLEENNQIIELGVIEIESRFKGQGTGRVLIEQPPPSKPISSSDIVFKKGQEGLWFLTISNYSNTIYLTNHPQQFWPKDKASELKTLIENCIND